MRTILDIKSIHKKIKHREANKRYRISNNGYIPHSELTPEELVSRRKKDVEKSMKLYRKRKENGSCIKCNNPAVMIAYMYDSKHLLTRRSTSCPNHWESIIIRKEMKDAISTGCTIHTVHPMVTLSHKSNANSTSKHV